MGTLYSQSSLHRVFLCPNVKEFLYHTNHLDLAALEWLEGFLSGFPGSVVVISHDRMFLDRVVTRIIEIDDGKANFYSGNYSFYAGERERRYLTQAEQYKQQQCKINHLPERPAPRSVSAEELINEAESELKNVNVKIDTLLQNSDYQNISSLYEKKRQLEERIDSLYNDWVEGSMR